MARYAHIEDSAFFSLLFERWPSAARMHRCDEQRASRWTLAREISSIAGRPRTCPVRAVRDWIDLSPTRSRHATTWLRRSTRNLGEARGHQEAVLKALRRLLGDEHPDTLTARNNLAVIVEAVESAAGQTSPAGL